MEPGCLVSPGWSFGVVGAVEVGCLVSLNPFQTRRTIASAWRVDGRVGNRWGKGGDKTGQWWARVGRRETGRPRCVRYVGSTYPVIDLERSGRVTAGADGLGGTGMGAGAK